MKEVLIIFLIILIIVLGSIFICKYLNKTSRNIIGDLERLKDDINRKESSKTELIKNAENIKQKWNDMKEKWSNIVLHQEIDSIEASIVRLKSRIEIGKQNEAIEDIETTIFLIKHIKEKEEMSWKNIF